MSEKNDGKGKRPSFQFYPGDWLRDAALRMCSSAARGLWIDMISFMHQAQPYGHLTFNGRPVDAVQLGKMVGETPKDVARWLEELRAAGVYSTDDNGAIYSRKMVRDELARAAWRHQQQAHRDRIKAAEHPDKVPDISPDIRPMSGEGSGASQPVLHSSSSSSRQKTRVLPDWVDPKTWADFLAMRREIRKPATDRAQVLLLGKLDWLRAQGNEPNAVLEQSIRNGWQDVFPLKGRQDSRAGNGVAL